MLFSQGSSKDSDAFRPPRYETRNATDRLNKILDLPAWEGMQDWDLVLADATRIGTFCDLYETGNLNADEKFALMRLVIASLDALRRQSTADNTDVVERAVHLLRQDFVLHFYTVKYWCLQDEADPANVFAATPLLRRVWQDCFRPEYKAWVETPEASDDL